MIHYSLGKYKKNIQEKAKILSNDNLLERFWLKDASLWKSETERKKLILDRLGWMDIANLMLTKLDEINDFVKDIRKDKFTHVVLLGMGGSSLCPEVLNTVFGDRKGYPKFFMLDSTDPLAVKKIESNINLKKILFIFSSKSGGTIEPSSQFKYFWYQVCKTRKTQIVGNQFCAITDPDTQLHKMAELMTFRKIFINPPDIGGRFSALSYFGLFPAALMGIDIKSLLNDAEKMRKKSIQTLSLEKNPSIYLGIILGELAQLGIDKATFLIPGKLSPLSYWLEQLIAESTGKEGKGVIPIEGENIENPEKYGKDRVFIVIRLKKEKSKSFDKKISGLKKAGFPVIEITLNDKYSIGGEFYRWEVATAIMGVVLGIDPFDQPNVQSAKDATGILLNDFNRSGQFKTESPKLKYKSISVYYDEKMEYALQRRVKKWNGSLNNLDDIMTGFFTLSEPDSYFAILAFLSKTDSIQNHFNTIRNQIQDKLHISTLQGYGPRYLHSIGQLYKGGPNSGLFWVITIGDKKDLKIPDSKYTFGQLKYAQAIGDYQALLSSNRRVLRIDLGKNYESSLNLLLKSLSKSLTRLNSIS